MKWRYCLIVILLFSACEDNRLTEGTVFKKEYKSTEKGYKTITTTKIHNRGRSTSTINKTFRVVYPDRWIISIHANSDTTDFFVKKEIYDTVEIGSWFTFDTTMGTFHEPYKRLTDK